MEKMITIVESTTGEIKSSNLSIIEINATESICFSEFIAIFAMLNKIFSIFGFATLR